MPLFDPRPGDVGILGRSPYSRLMYYVASSGKSTEVSVRVPLWRVRRTYAPAGAIHACAADSHEAACGVPLSLLILWPEHDFATHEFPHGCPNCAVVLAQSARATAPEGFVVPDARHQADELAHPDETQVEADNLTS